MNLVAQMIKGQQPVEEHQLAIRQREVVLGVLANLFQLAHHIVGKIANGPGSERRQPRHRGRLMLAQQFLHHLKHVALAMLPPPAAFDLDGRLPRPQPHVGPRSQERVAADLLAALDRLQQKRVWFVLRNRQKSRHRREQVGAHRFHHRHQRGRTRQTRELFELWKGHE